MPDLLIEVDAVTRFSWTVLGRPPRSEHKLVILYAALIALGSDLTAADMMRMTVNIEENAVVDMMRRIEADGRLPMANRLVLDHFRTLPVTRLWDVGLHASADMMSIDTAHHLWRARYDPRRRTPAIGTYTHVLDQLAILHDQPIILNRRQAGAAIEGALRDEQIDLHLVAVDTRGHRRGESPHTRCFSGSPLQAHRPNAHGHINTKGVITIDVSRHRDRLIAGHAPMAKVQSAI